MSADDVASLLSVSTRQLRNYCNLGCPFEERDRKRVFAWPKVLDWYVVFKSGGVPADEPEDASEADEPGPGRKENLTQANLRKTKAEANLKELVLAQKRSQVIGITDVKAILDRLFGNLKSQLLGAAPLLNTRLEGEPDSVAREAAIRDFMENLCRELATGKIVRDAVSEAQSEETERIEDEEETINDLKASADDISDEELNHVVFEFLASHEALREAEDAG